jgi:RimJ/RimL family protein N-acetyltransferase
VIFERTADLGLVRSILTDPGVYPYIADDFSPAREDFAVNAHPDIRYVLAIDGGRLAGMFVFLPRSAIRWDVHVAMLRKVPPAVTHRAGREIVAWLWENTACQRLVAEVPVCNKAAVRFGLQAMEMKAFGRDRAAFARHGQLQDLILMGIGRPV